MHEILPLVRKALISYWLSTAWQSKSSKHRALPSSVSLIFKNMFESFGLQEKKKELFPGELKLAKNHFDEKGYGDKTVEMEKQACQVHQLKHHSWLTCLLPSQDSKNY